LYYESVWTVIFEHFVSELNLITALIKILHGQLFLRSGCREWFISKVDQRKKIKIDKRLIFITTDHFRGFFLLKLVMAELDEIIEILNKSREFYEKGFTMMNEGNNIIYDEIYKYPNDFSLRLALADQMAGMGNFHDAIELYQIVLLANPKDPYALTGLATIYFELGKLPESLKLAHVSLNIRDMPKTKILLCRHYLSQGNLIEVKKILSEILRKEPNNPQAILLNQRVEHVRA